MGGPGTDTAWSQRVSWVLAAWRQFSFGLWDWEKDGRGPSKGFRDFDFMIMT
jgi:hypothetical protein